MTLLTDQRRITRRLLRHIVRAWPALDPLNLAATWPAVLRALLPAVVEEHHTAGEAAVASYLAQRAADVSTVAQGVLFNPVPAEMDLQALERVRASLTITGPVSLQKSLNRGVQPAEASRAALVQVQGAATRHALAGARETTLAAVAEDPVALGWARIPRPDACPFCTLLGTRGAEYKSRESAGPNRRSRRHKTAAGLEFVGEGEFKVHDHCRCVAQPIFAEDWEPPEHIARAEQIYATSTAGKSGKAARQAFAAAITADRKTAA